jgi:S-adenosylmethionine hydrolase
VEKKIKKLIKLKNQKTFWKNRTVKKTIKNFKKIDRFGLVWFQFYKSETKKTEPKPKQNQAKSKKTESNQKNQVKPVWTGFCP